MNETKDKNAVRKPGSYFCSLLSEHSSGQAAHQACSAQRIFAPQAEPRAEKICSPSMLGGVEKFSASNTTWTLER
uniref:Uncharacterized protein n=1 Tax=Romanomermis culicivorax TaxID=13658 RepID=A0A915HN87_ROMCU